MARPLEFLFWIVSGVFLGILIAILITERAEK